MGLAELVDINGGSRNEYRVVGVSRYKGGKRIAEIKSILWILAILRGVYGVMGPSFCAKNYQN